MPQSSPYLSHNVNEILGVYHNKYYLLDNTVILSGANLSSEYLTNRQDRYILFDVSSNHKTNTSNCTDLISWLKAYTAVIVKYCYQLRPGLSISEPEITDLTRLTTELNRLLYTTSSLPPQPVVIPYTLPYTPQCTGGGDNNTVSQSTQPPPTVYLVPLVQFAQIGIKQESTLLSTYFNNLFGHNSDPSAASGTSYKVDVTLSSPYPSYPDELLHALVAHRSHPTTTACTTVTTADTTGSKGGDMAVAYSFLTAAPHTHGFHRGYGLKSLVPLLHAEAFNQAYSVFIDKLYSRFSTNATNKSSSNSNNNTNTNTNTNTSCQENVSVRSLQYSRPGWTFHAKGIWVFTKPLTARDKQPLPCTNNNNTPQPSDISLVEEDMNAFRAYLKPLPHTPPPLHLTQPPPQPFTTLTYIGSSNLGTRSRLRDFELGFLLFSRNCSVQRVYREELRHLLSNSTPATTTTAPNTHTGTREASESVVRISPSSGIRPKPEIKRVPSSGDRLLRVLSRLVRSFL